MPGCNAPPLKKMLQHLRQYHKLAEAEIRQYLQKKKYASLKDIANWQSRGRSSSSAPPTGCSDIRSVFERVGDNAGGSVGKRKGKGKVGVAEGGNKRMEEVGEDAGFEVVSDGEGTKDVVGEGSSRASTRGMKVHEGKFYQDFQTYLMSREGGNKSKNNAKGIAKNVAKFHYFANPATLDPNQSLKAKSVRTFIQNIEETGIGPSGLIQKILDIETSIKFLLYRAEDTDDEQTITSKAYATFAKLALLRKSFRGEKDKKEREALEDLAGNLPSLDNIKEFWESDEVTQKFLAAIEGLSHCPKKGDYNTALAIIGGRLLFR